MTSPDKDVAAIEAREYALSEWRERIGQRLMNTMVCTHTWTEGAVCGVCWDNTQRIGQLIEAELRAVVPPVRAERDRYRAAWQSARRRAAFDWLTSLIRHWHGKYEEKRATVDRARAHLAEWAARDCIAGNRWFDGEGNPHHVACFHCAAAEMTPTLDGEGTDG